MIKQKKDGPDPEQQNIFNLKQFGAGNLRILAESKAIVVHSTRNILASLNASNFVIIEASFSSGNEIEKRFNGTPVFFAIPVIISYLCGLKIRCPTL